MTWSIKPENLLSRHGISAGQSLLSSAEVQPRAYLEFANADLEAEDSPRTRVNAVTNAKRAMHIQAEVLTNALGYRKWKGGLETGFKRRLEFLSACNLASQAILANVMQLRGSVEYDNAIPTRDDAEDCTDVVEMFLCATDPFVNSFTVIRELEARNASDSTISVIVASNAGDGVVRVYEGSWAAFFSSIKFKENPKEGPIKLGWFPSPELPLLSTFAVNGTDYLTWLRILLGS